MGHVIFFGGGGKGSKREQEGASAFKAWLAHGNGHEK